MAKYYRINSDDITFKLIDNEAVILNLKTGDYYSLNESGTFIWRLLEASLSLESLRDRLTQEYSIDPKIAIRDIKRLLSDLISEKIISEQNY